MRIALPFALLTCLAACAPREQVAQQSPRQIVHDACVSSGFTYNTPLYRECMIRGLRYMAEATTPPRRPVDWGAYSASTQLLQPYQAAAPAMQTNTLTYRGRTTTCNTTGLPGMQSTNCF